MAQNTSIEWTDHTFNPFIGCTKVSPGCDNCYAEHLMDTRMHKVVWGPKGERVRTSAANWKKPRQWNRQSFYACNECGWRGDTPGHTKYVGGGHYQVCPACSKGVAWPTRQRVFCASLADVFDNAAPSEWRKDLAVLILETPNLDWLLLTKRIGNAAKMLAEMFPEGLPDNVWIGATIVDQAEADRDIPKLMKVPAYIHFLSMEPLLGPVDLKLMQYEDSDHKDETGRIIANTRRRVIKWVIVGGESGTGARPMHPQWARSLRDQCAGAGVHFLFKQWGEWVPRSACYHLFADGKSCADMDPGCKQWPSMRLTEAGHNGRDLAHAGAGDDAYMQRVGKAMGGRLLDGRTHDGFPGKGVQAA